MAIDNRFQVGTTDTQKRGHNCPLCFFRSGNEKEFKAHWKKIHTKPADEKVARANQYYKHYAKY